MNRPQSPLPEGVRDVLSADCRRKRRIENGLCDLFARWGYDEVASPAIEYLDTFLTGGEQSPERLIKLVDAKGRLLALRPDLTTSMARIAATRLRGAPLPLRLGYCQEAFSFLPLYGRCQYAQAGVERIGDDGPAADAEVIALSIRALLAMGLDEFQIDVGQVEYFRGLIEEAGVDAESAERVRAFVEEKNMLGVEIELAGNRDAHKRLCQLPMLYGGPEVLDEAARLSSHPKCIAAIENIRRIFEIVAQYGLAEYLSVDLGMVHALHYYTGVIFRGISPHIGYPLLSGGRYDGLMGDFGRPLHATGFAIEVDGVLDALDRMQPEPEIGPDLLMAYAPDVRAEAIVRIEALRAQGFRIAAFECDAGADGDAAAIAQAAAMHARGCQRFDGSANPTIYDGDAEGGEGA